MDSKDISPLKENGFINLEETGSCLNCEHHEAELIRNRNGCHHWCETTGFRGIILGERDPALCTCGNHTPTFTQRKLDNTCEVAKARRRVLRRHLDRAIEKDIIIARDKECWEGKENE